MGTQLEVHGASMAPRHVHVDVHCLADGVGPGDDAVGPVTSRFVTVFDRGVGTVPTRSAARIGLLLADEVVIVRVFGQVVEAHSPEDVPRRWLLQEQMSCHLGDNG